MKPYYQDNPVPIDAAQWVLRHDRGLTPQEQDEFSQWLAADPVHRAEWAEHRWGWEELDRLVGLQTSLEALPDPDLLAPRRQVWPAATVWKFTLPALAAAAVVALGFLLLAPRGLISGDAPVVPRTIALIEQRTLADGSVVELNRGAVVTEHFAPGERLIRLERGEAHFQVAHDPARPFIVEAAGVAVRAIGTAFNVRLDPAAVEVLVTAGRVGVHRLPVDPAASEDRATALRPDTIQLAAGERTVVSFAPTSPVPQVTLVDPAEIEARLAWQPRRRDFTAAPMPEIVAEFNRRNPVRVLLVDEEVAAMRLSATFRSDNVEGFLRLMESDFDLRAEWRGESDVLLRRVP
jgi:transmembrane sensor